MTARCASPSCRGLVGAVSRLGVCAGCSTSTPYGDEGISSSVFDDDLAWDRDQVAEMKGWLDE